MKPRATQPPPKASRLYWLCQAAGWGSVMLYALTAYVVLGGRRNLRAVTAIVIVDAVLCPALTHALRHWMYRRGWIPLAPRRLIPRAMAAALVLAVCVTAVAAIWSALIVDASERLGGEALFWTFVAFVWAFGGWLLIYFTVHARRRHDARELELTLDARNAQLSLLRAQLNPHFLFNCLNSIRGMVGEHPDRATAMITSLADLLRYSLTSDRRDTVTLADEMAIVEEYISLERVRFEERLRFERSIGPPALTARVPPLLVHTLVENAVKHGIADRPAGGTVRIEAMIIGERLTITVTNTGTLRTGASDSGYGLPNTMQRLRLLYGDRATFTLTDRSGDTVATVTFPLDALRERAAG